MKLLQEYWWLLWGIAAPIAIVWYRLKRRGGDEPLLRRTILVANPIVDPASEQYDGNFPNRALLIVFVGLTLIGLAYVAVWVLRN